MTEPWVDWSVYSSNGQISILEALTLFGVEAVLLCACRIVSHSIEARMVWTYDCADPCHCLNHWNRATIQTVSGPKMVTLSSLVSTLVSAWIKLLDRNETMTTNWTSWLTSCHDVTRDMHGQHLSCCARIGRALLRFSSSTPCYRRLNGMSNPTVLRALELRFVHILALRNSLWQSFHIHYHILKRTLACQFELTFYTWHLLLFYVFEASLVSTSKEEIVLAGRWFMSKCKWSFIK